MKSTTTGISWADLIPFSAAERPEKPDWMRSPWIHGDYAYATDSRIIVRARIDDYPLPDTYIPPEHEAQRENAVAFFYGQLAISRDWTVPRFPPGGLPPQKMTLCPKCQRAEPDKTPDPVILDNGRLAFDANVLRLLHDLPVELDFFVADPYEPGRFFTHDASFTGIVMPMRLSHDRMAERTMQQWGKSK